MTLVLAMSVTSLIMIIVFRRFNLRFGSVSLYQMLDYF